MAMKRLVAQVLTPICSGLMYLLHNRTTFSFNRLELQSVQFSFSQFGEDLMIRQFAQRIGLANGVYVDVGAYHPTFGSNTLLLHKEGWRGINIDFVPERIAAFNQSRPNDHNVVACVSDSVAGVEIAHYEIPSTDRIVASNDTERLSAAGQKPIRFSRGTTTTLTEIIGASPFRFEEVRYLDVDCEGHDLAVLRGLDFEQCRPDVLSVEAASEPEREAIVKFLAPYGYRLEVNVPPTAIFINSRSRFS
jgi:FkbM family methyltransferase